MDDPAGVEVRHGLRDLPKEAGESRTRVKKVFGKTRLYVDISLKTRKKKKTHLDGYM